MICALGLEDHLVGVTHECDFPPSVQRLPKVTRTLIPTDAPSGEIDRLVRERLQKDRALYTLDLQVLQDAEEVISGLTDRVAAVVARTGRAHQRPRAALLEWLDPPFSCGHWSPELVRLAGGIEGLGEEGGPSRMLHWNEVLAWQPEVVLIACCGFSVERTLCDVPALRLIPGWQEMLAVRSDRVYVTDGSQYFSRPGPRLVDSLEILAHALHPDLHPLPAGLPAPIRASTPSMFGPVADVSP
jgi:iron complex transport system substrate-binding protein